MPTDDFFLLGILNSESVWGYIKETFACLGDPHKNGRFRLIYQSTVKIPVPKATVKEKAAISALVQKCLDAKGENCSRWESEINSLVSQLYGL